MDSVQESDSKRANIVPMQYYAPLLISDKGRKGLD
jgi:hypothetical protein